MLRNIILVLALAAGISCVNAQRHMEKLNRGFIAIPSITGDSVYLSWRFFGTDPANIGFNLYKDNIKLNATPIQNSTNYLDVSGGAGNYLLKTVSNDTESAHFESPLVFSNGCLTIPLLPPAGGMTPDSVVYTYTPNDCSTADLDGDGEYEIILKWDPTNSKDNSLKGYTGNVFIDAYKLNGTRLWRIDLGRNIRAGAHYTQFLVYDFASNGLPVMICKTADGTIDGQGNVIGDINADYRNSSGYILSGPEYLTVFNGRTGAIINTIGYDPPRGTVSSWGDSYGNRVDRFLACVAYLDSIHPSAVFCRGYYTRTVLCAYNFTNGALSQKWKFDTNLNGLTGY
jgi:rhamnogalacturonan endolyase